MPQITVKLEKVSPTGAHLQFGIYEDGQLRLLKDHESYKLERGDPNEIAEALILAVARIVKRGRTKAQTRAILEAGVTLVL